VLVEEWVGVSVREVLVVKGLGQELVLVEASGQGQVLCHGQSGSPLLFSEKCRQTSSSNACHQASAMSMRCSRSASRMLCNTPCGYSLDQCHHR